MARKHKKDAQAYWDKLLLRKGLSMERGRSKRLSYVGGTQILDALRGAQEAGTRTKEGDLDISYPKKGG
jgi:hypothetical protein